MVITKNGEILIDGVKKKSHFHTEGYERICHEGIVYYIHRLVAETYIPNPEGKPFVNHINGIKTDNRVENLEWTTPAENFYHARDNKLWGKNILEKRKFNETEIKQIRKKYIPRKYTIKKLALEFDVDYKTIYNIVNKISYKEID